MPDETFAPAPAFAAQANANTPAIYAEAARDPERYWADWARKLTWFHPFSKVSEFTTPTAAESGGAKWFLGGTLNACYNCVDRHAEAHPTRRAIVWEGEPVDENGEPETRTLTYKEVQREVERIANGLLALGVTKGDRVAIYLPMVPELPMTMLACARIGAAHVVVFGGFSAESLADRANDAGAKLIVTADGGYRRGKVVPLLEITKEAVALGIPTVHRVLVLERIGAKGSLDLPASDGTQYVAWSDIVGKESSSCPCVPMDSEDLLFILHTSGSTGKPKGIVHTTGGYLTGVMATSHLVFDLKPATDLHFCTADCGWITGHSYIVYGPMANGATVLLYEGAPDFPDKDRFWSIIARHKATILYTAPTAIRSFMKWGDEYPARHDLSSLRLLGSVGEPINPEAWRWYSKHIGGDRCPVVDTWWQTETGAIMIAPLPGLTATKPGSATFPLPGIEIRVRAEDGSETALNGPGTGEPKEGALVIARPWPSMTRGIWNDPKRFADVYWGKFEDRYFAGDGAKVDEDGYLWLLGRIDDIMLVAGHNVSTAEVESALVSHPAVAEAAVIGKAHEIKGQAIAAFVILRAGASVEPEELKRHVAAKLGPITRPDDVYLTADLPKTRSGKIMRRLLRDVAEGRALGDTTTLADPAVVAALKGQYEASEG